MKILLLIVVVLTALGGCVVAPVGPDYGYYDRYDRYGYGYSYPYAYPRHPYYYGPYYRRGYYWRQAP